MSNDSGVGANNNEQIKRFYKADLNKKVPSKKILQKRTKQNETWNSADDKKKEAINKKTVQKNRNLMKSKIRALGDNRFSVTDKLSYIKNLVKSEFKEDKLNNHLTKKSDKIVTDYSNGNVETELAKASRLSEKATTEFIKNRIAHKIEDQARKHNVNVKESVDFKELKNTGKDFFKELKNIRKQEKKENITAKKQFDVGITDSSSIRASSSGSKQTEKKCSK